MENCKRETIEVKGAKQSEIRGVIKMSKSMQIGEQGIIKQNTNSYLHRLFTGKNAVL